MDDHECAELLRLREKFLEIMRREPAPPVFDEAARERTGQMIGKAARRGRSDVAVKG